MAFVLSIPFIIHGVGKDFKINILDPGRKASDTTPYNRYLFDQLAQYNVGEVTWSVLEQRLDKVVADESTREAICSVVYNGLDDYLDRAGSMAFTGGNNDPAFVMVRPKGKQMLKVESVGEQGYEIFGKCGGADLDPGTFWYQYWQMMGYGKADKTKSATIRQQTIGAIFFMLKQIIQGSSSSSGGAGSSSTGTTGKK